MKEVHLYADTAELGTVRCDGKKYYFSYTTDWIQRGFPICPGMPLDDTVFQSDTLFPVFTDACPDAWGIKVLQNIEILTAHLENRHPKLLNRLEILERTNNFTRQGILTTDCHYTRQIENNDSVQLAADCILLERSHYDLDPHILINIARNQISSGGARPKFNFMKNGELWLCKCSSSEDTFIEQGWEALNLTLARNLGLHVPDFNYDPEHRLLFIKRFDRNGAEKIPYISAATYLNRTEGSYAEIARVCDPADRPELFRRICVNILVANFDDHLKNHGFLYQSGKWRLSPLFDVQSLPQSLGMPLHATPVHESNSFSDLQVLLDCSETFMLSKNEGREIIEQFRSIVFDNWEELAVQYGLQNEMLIFRNVYFRCTDTLVID